MFLLLVCAFLVVVNAVPYSGLIFIESEDKAVDGLQMSLQRQWKFSQDEFYYAFAVESLDAYQLNIFTLRDDGYLVGYNHTKALFAQTDGTYVSDSDRLLWFQPSQDHAMPLFNLTSPREMKLTYDGSPKFYVCNTTDLAHQAMNMNAVLLFKSDQTPETPCSKVSLKLLI
ncbi:hypothetical protein TRICI_004395 [Trichomonascus ciferrii]|uniref:Uncharacterized protein n=1 Tax=Trichomonascus ciferrii TaxID=44093 RepID=A0A642V146_9ASCO|nr:hypothetical protein TRICI_004395 [Trichomonascus ciferrii]